MVERLHLESLDRIGDNTTAVGSNVAVKDAIFREHLSHKTTLSNDLKFDRARMNMWGVESTRSKKSNGHASTRSNKSRESLAIGGNEIASMPSLALQRRIPEVENELRILWKKGESINCGVCKEELLGKIQRDSSCTSRSRASWSKRGSSRRC